MVDVLIILSAISFILFFGFFAEFVFRKFDIADVLFLIILGFLLGPHVLNYVTPASLTTIAPVFTTFTLLFLLFDGAFNINLRSLVKEFSHSFTLTTFNFVLSSLSIAIVVWLLGHWVGNFSVLTSLLIGFLLGGVSSSFAIPILKEMNVKGKIYSLLAIESALTDVFCIVFSITVLKIMELGQFGIRATITQLMQTFAVAALVGVLGGIIWIVLTIKVFKEQHNYMAVIAFLILLYVATELLHGNGAIATLCFGLILKNSKQLSSITKGIVTTKKKDKKNALKGSLGVAATTHSEEFFYHQISFFLKTFFFVYIGILIDISDWRALVIGLILSVLIMFTRNASSLLTHRIQEEGQALVNAVFARGLAAAAIAQLALEAGIPGAALIVKISFVTITGTIILSSAKVFLVKHRYDSKLAAKTK